MGRCISTCIKEGLTEEQAKGKCYGMWKETQKESLAMPTVDESKDAFMQRCKLEKTGEVATFPNLVSMHAELTTLLGQNAQAQALKDEEIKTACETEWRDRPTRDDPIGGKPQPGDDTQPGRDGQQNSEPRKRELYTFDANCDQAIEFISDKIELDVNVGNKFSAVAVIGDRFYHNKFLPYAEIAKAAESMNGAYHDINHWGTTYTDGNPNIEYIIGYQKNTTTDPLTKRMKTDIFVNENAPHYKTWKNFIDVSKQAGRTPNVSVSFWGSNKSVKARELPKGINYEQYGYKENDDVPYLYDLQFQALSTVLQGACDDKAGCGIGIGLKQDTTIVEDKLEKLELEIEIEKQRRKK